MKSSKWQFFLILTVVVLAVYNILPTIFFYSKPLKNPITSIEAQKICDDIEQRLQKQLLMQKEWLESFCHLIHVNPQKIDRVGSHFVIRFTKSNEAASFREHLPRALSSIRFEPARMFLLPQDEHTKEVYVGTMIPEKLEKKHFEYAAVGSELYKKVMIDRAAALTFVLAGPSEQAARLMRQDKDSIEMLCYEINTLNSLPESQKSVTNRICKSFTRASIDNSSKALQNLIAKFQLTRDELKKAGKDEKRQASYYRAEQFIKKYQNSFISDVKPLYMRQILEELASNDRIDISSHNPLFSEVAILWDQNRIELKLHPDVDYELLKQQLMNEAAKLHLFTDEKVHFSEGSYSVHLHDSGASSGILVLNYESLESKDAREIKEFLQTRWQPEHPDLQSMSIVEQDEFEQLAPEEKALSFLISAPTEENPNHYLAAQGLTHIQSNYLKAPDSELAQVFQNDFRSLVMLLAQKGYRAQTGPNQEILFHNPNKKHVTLASTRENFKLRGTKRFATLELSSLEERLITQNRIDNTIHEELIKWQDDYNSAQISLDERLRFSVPKPTKSIFFQNALLSLKKLFRGDDQRVIRWGLDLSGGKTVQIELKDANQRQVTNDEDIKQGINELYTRVNKMGVSEVAIRKLGNNIVLDFPGSQSFSASELIRASSMYFHVVNEKFSSLSSPLAPASQQFLQEVWNEAVVTNKKDEEGLQKIAYQKLHGEMRSESAKILLDNGLQLMNPENSEISSALDDTVSKIAMIRSDEKWFGQTHPLMFVFKNYALEGSELSSVQANYDPQKGNYLVFDVKGSTLLRSGEKSNPRNAIKTWTSRFAKEQVAGTPLEEYTRGSGWRMAVILNGTLISAPTLDAVIRDSASISGSFSQMEVNKLASDLKAGSLTFTPHILSEKNVSPDLGYGERVQGIIATIVALALVIIAMIAYYRFAGLIASIAVLFNLLILWATLQNIGATLSLAGIAGIILTVGMAVDANVLVFERFKEEFNHSKSLRSAITAGYQKAYSAIVDSNVTTIIAALILLNFDAGPIKGFAITLIIGIASSMFSALFMTKYFFESWVGSGKEKTLNMANWISATSIDFLKSGKKALAIATLVITLGCALIYQQRATIFGMDFTGGFSLHVELEPSSKALYLDRVESALKNQGLSPQDFQVRELTPANHLRILFARSMENPNMPFYQMAAQTEHGTNPRIDWVLNTLNHEELPLTKHSLENIDANWTAMSGQMSDTMRNNALLGLLIAFVSIFIYIAFRFEYKYAAASILCVLHDVLITLGVVGILHFFKVPLQIDLNTIAAIMTIVGYSLNDTIIIFDRIREEVKLHPNQSLAKTVNYAINATLSRTSITSLTTLLVLVALCVLGGASIFSFALVMTIGVVLGTLSSWYIAAPLMLYFERKEMKAITS